VVLEVIKFNEREFIFQIYSFSNGNIAMISEGKEIQMGSITMSSKYANEITSTNIVPPKTSVLLPKLISEIITHKLGGINIISCYFENELDNETSKYIMTSIQNILQKEQLSEQ